MGLIEVVVSPLISRAPSGRDVGKVGGYLEPRVCASRGTLGWFLGSFGPGGGMVGSVWDYWGYLAAQRAAGTSPGRKPWESNSREIPVKLRSKGARERRATSTLRTAVSRI